MTLADTSLFYFVFKKCSLCTPVSVTFDHNYGEDLLDYSLHEVHSTYNVTLSDRWDGKALKG